MPAGLVGSGPSSSRPARPWTADQARDLGSGPAARVQYTGGLGFVEYLTKDLVGVGAGGGVCWVLASGRWIVLCVDGMWRDVR